MLKDSPKGYTWFHLYDILKKIKLSWWRTLSGHQGARIEKECDDKGIAWGGLLRWWNCYPWWWQRRHKSVYMLKFKELYIKKQGQFYWITWNENFKKHKKNIRKKRTSPLLFLWAANRALCSDLCPFFKGKWAKKEQR